MIVNQLFAGLAADEELGGRLPAHHIDYPVLVERITGLPGRGRTRSNANTDAKSTRP